MTLFNARMKLGRTGVLCTPLYSMNNLSMVKKSLLFDTLLQFFVSTFISIKNETFHEYGAKHNFGVNNNNEQIAAAGH